MNLGRVAATTTAQLKMMFRRRITLFWSLVFPMILMTLLGLLFGQTINAGTITVIDVAHTPAATAMVKALNATDGVTIKQDQHDPAKAEQQVRDGDRDALVVLRPGSGSTTVAQLMAIADANQIMPPKSTWFEPKLRSGLFIHTF